MKSTKDLIKNQSGITLIVLVITIIVLIILASISISLSINKNGILSKAQDSKILAEEKTVEEKVKLSILTAIANSEDGKLSADKLINAIETDYGSDCGATAKKIGDGFPILATIDDKNFLVDKDGNVTPCNSGSGSENSSKPTEGITVVSGDGKSVGDVVSIKSNRNTTEEFYIIAYDSDTHVATAIAKYNLKVGNIYDPTSEKLTPIDTTSSGYGLQDSTMKGHDFSAENQPYNGVTSFSNSLYWYDFPNNSYTLDNSTVDNHTYPYVYNRQSNIYNYLESYRAKLNNVVCDVRLASYEEINPLKDSYTWAYTSSYWFGSLNGKKTSGNIYFIGSINNSYIYQSSIYSAETDFGVRPVITFIL